MKRNFLLIEESVMQPNLLNTLMKHFNIYEMIFFKVTTLIVMFYDWNIT